MEPAVINQSLPPCWEPLLQVINAADDLWGRIPAAPRPAAGSWGAMAASCLMKLQFIKIAVLQINSRHAEPCRGAWLMRVPGLGERGREGSLLRAQRSELCSASAPGDPSAPGASPPAGSWGGSQPWDAECPWDLHSCGLLGSVPALGR